MTAETRRRRQYEVVVAAAATGDLVRATALLAEHISEFPRDAGRLKRVIDYAAADQ